MTDTEGAKKARSYSASNFISTEFDLFTYSKYLDTLFMARVTFSLAPGYSASYWRKLSSSNVTVYKIWHDLAVNV